MNDWMQQEIHRQANEAGDPAAQTSSWVVPTRQRFDVSLMLGLGAIALAAVMAVLLAGALR
jgi:hypothetical protein